MGKRDVYEGSMPYTFSWKKLRLDLNAIVTSFDAETSLSGVACNSLKTITK